MNTDSLAAELSRQLAIAKNTWIDSLMKEFAPPEIYECGKTPELRANAAAWCQDNKVRLREKPGGIVEFVMDGKVVGRAKFEVILKPVQIIESLKES